METQRVNVPVSVQMPFAVELGRASVTDDARKLSAGDFSLVWCQGKAVLVIFSGLEGWRRAALQLIG